MTRTEFSDLEIVEDSLEIIDSSNSDRIALLPISHRDERDDRSSSSTLRGSHSIGYGRRGNRSSSSNVMLDLPTNMSTGPGVPQGTSIIDDASALKGSGMIGRTATDHSEASNSFVSGMSDQPGNDRPDGTSELRSAAQKIWKMCLETIRPQISSQTMRTWFEPLAATQLEGSEITLRAPSNFFCEWITEHYQKILEDSLKAVLGPSARFRFDSESEIESLDTKLEAAAPNIAPKTPAARSNKATNEPPPRAEVPAQPQAARAPAFETGQERAPGFAPAMSSPRGQDTHSNYAQSSGQGASNQGGTRRPSDSRPPVNPNLNPRYTFDTFIRGESNKLAYAAAMAVANNPGGTRYNPLVIYGNVGLGKTHLIQAIGTSVVQKFPGGRVLYTSSDKFTVEFVDSIQNDRQNEFQSLYRSIDVLIIDDVQFFAGKEKTQDIFFHTFNALRELGKQLILTCDRPPKELKDIDDRLLNRLQWGLTADIGAPDLETRIAILRHKAIADGIELPNNVIEFIATNVTTNIRELEGCLISLLATASLEGKEPTIEVAKDVLRKVAKRSAPILSIEIIQRTVAKKFGIEEELLRSKTRKQEIVQARQVAMYLTKELTNSSLKTIGLHFGGRDHSTVIHSCTTILDDIRNDPALQRMVEELRRQFELMQ